MCAWWIRASGIALATTMTFLVAATNARADFLILKDGRAFRGELTTYEDGSMATSESKYSYDKEQVARCSTLKTAEEVIEKWGSEIGACKSTAERDACMSLAKFCAFVRKYKDAEKYFALWGERRKWSVLSSKFYFILSNAKAKRVKELRDRLDAIMRFYQKEFGEKREMKQDFVVRFFRTDDQFQEFARQAGMEGSGAFYDPELRELVLPDLSHTNKNFTFEAVYHEANHQYVGSYFLNQEPSHSWFSEGLATYYESAKFKGKRIVAHGKMSLDYRVTLREGIRAGRVTPLKDFLVLQRDGFYCGGEQESLNYAQAWGFIYFLKNTKVKECRRFLATYIETLKATEKDAEALAKAFECIGCAKLEKEFLAFATKF